MSLVMIVDDEPHVRQILKRWIEDAGYQLCEAESAEQALEVMAKTPAGVVFCDVQMPGGNDGLWLTGQLRTLYPTAAVVLATGVSTVPPKVSMQSGVLAYLVKPFQRQPLLDALRQGLQWHEDRMASGPMPEDSAENLKDWLDELKDI